jgi:hypothetical protein
VVHQFAVSAHLAVGSARGFAFGELLEVQQDLSVVLQEVPRDFATALWSPESVPVLAACLDRRAVVLVAALMSELVPVPRSFHQTKHTRERPA